MKPNGNHTPHFNIINNEYIEFVDDDISLSVFLRKVGPEILDALRPFQQRMEAGEKLSIIELFGFLELWRQLISFVWAAHSPGRQQESFENKIRDVWNNVRKAQQRIYDRCVEELERRGVHHEISH